MSGRSTTLSGTARIRSGIGGWRTALRIAAREARRAKGRTALVVAMIALPVLALGFAAVTYDMFRLTPAERLDRQLGAADAQLTWVSEQPITQNIAGTTVFSDSGPRARPASTAELLATLPPGSRATPVGHDGVDLRTAVGIGSFPIRRLDLADPMTDGMARLHTGHLPASPTEIVVSDKALRRLGIPIGGTITLADGTRSYALVGVVEFPDNLGEVVVMPPDGRSEPLEAWLVDTPGPVDIALVRQLNQRGIQVTSRAMILNPPPPGEAADFPGVGEDSSRTLDTAAIIAGLGVLEVVLLAGPAFAVGARRRRRDLGLVAASGGTPAHLRRIVLADGVVLGATGAVVGLALGVSVAVAGRPLVEEFLAGSRTGGYRFFPLALIGIAGLAVVTGTLAALVPAFTAARQDVIAALTGRRGVVRSRKRWLAAGLALAASGAAVASLGVVRVATDLIIGGLVLAEIGLVLSTPSLVGLVARIGSRTPLALRIALRDTARNRAAAAPAISAVMAAVASSVVIGVYLINNDERQEGIYQPALPPGYVTVSSGEPARHTVPATDPVPGDQIATAASASLPVSNVAELRIPDCPPNAGPGSNCSLDPRLPPERQCPFFAPSYDLSQMSDQDKRRARADVRCKLSPPGIISNAYTPDVVDDGTALPILTGAQPDDLARATAALKAGGVVVTDPKYVVNGKVTVDIITQTGQGDMGVTSRPVTLPGYALTTGAAIPRTVYSPAALARTGLVAHQFGWAIATDATPTIEQQDRFTGAVHDLSPALQVGVERGQPDTPNNPSLVVLAIAAGVITLGAAGIATGLAAADGKADLSTLAAVGASPRLRRALALSQSGVIAGLGTLLGVAAGLASTLAILAALNHGYAERWPPEDLYPMLIPWRTLGVLLVVPPLAMLGAGLLTRSRLPIERRLR